MRDLLVTAIVFGLLPLIFWRPYIGILLWSWLSYMNPHRQTWGFAYDMPFAQIVAITLLLAMVFRGGPFKLPFRPVLFVWIGLLAWMAVTTMFAIFPADAQAQLIKVYKIQIVTFLTMMLITDLRKINMLVTVIVASIGYYSVKGGVFTLVTGGAHRVFGPTGTYIEENNGLAIAILMIVPLMFYLRSLLEKAWARNAMIGAMVLSLVSVVGSQSRGALIAISTLAVFFWLKSKQKMLSAIFMVLLAVGLVAFMPQSWHERMGTISSYEEDASAMGRINAWRYAINVASDRITGAGFESWSLSTFSRWAPNPQDVHAAHSIYFGMLADHGWLGLLLFVTVLTMTWRSLSRVERNTRDAPEFEQHNLLARMLKVSLIAYFSGGAFLSLTYFDLPWHLVAISLLLETQLQAKGTYSNGSAIRANSNPMARQQMAMGSRVNTPAMRRHAKGPGL